MSERILIVAEHKAIADLWVQLNADALQHPEQEVRIVTAADERYIRGLTMDRTIVLGKPDIDGDQIAIVTRRGPAQLIRMQHTDRLAALWRAG
jgi:hypothetical protein